MRIAIGCDHRGLNVKRAVAEYLRKAGYEVQDVGAFNEDSVDYPDIARDVAQAVAQGRAEQGVLVCGTGIGMSIVANKVAGVRAALCMDAFTAERARAHNDANVLCLGESVGTPEKAVEIVKAYLSASFEGGRHARRVEKIRQMDSARTAGPTPRAGMAP